MYMYIDIFIFIVISVYTHNLAHIGFRVSGFRFVGKKGIQLFNPYINSIFCYFLLTPSMIT